MNIRRLKSQIHLLTLTCDSLLVSQVYAIATRVKQFHCVLNTIPLVLNAEMKLTWNDCFEYLVLRMVYDLVCVYMCVCILWDLKYPNEYGAFHTSLSQKLYTLIPNDATIVHNIIKIPFWSTGDSDFYKQ